MIHGIKVSIVILSIALILGAIIKVIYINLTPGYYQEYGCCTYDYLTEEGLVKENNKLRNCAFAMCQQEDTIDYKINFVFFNRLDFNK